MAPLIFKKRISSCMFDCLKSEKGWPLLKIGGEVGDGVRDVCRRSQGAMPSVVSAIIREPYGIFHDENAWQRISLANTRGAVSAP